MRKKIIGIFVCMLMITTCVMPVMGERIAFKKSSNDTNPLDSSNSTLEFMIAGKALRALHSYWLHVPPSYDGSKPVPLVIVLHYSDNFNLFRPFYYYRYNGMELLTNFSQKADEEGFIVVYPNQKVNWLRFAAYDYDLEYFTIWPWRFIDDMGFIKELINKMKRDYTINASRIYATGFSDGGFMSYSIGAYLSDTVAAIAPVAGSIGMHYFRFNPMHYIPTPENPVSVIAFHGTKDITVFYDNDPFLTSVNESVSFWVTHNKCDPTPEIYTSASGNIIRKTYTDGENGTEVVLYTLVGGGHTWPGTFKKWRWLGDDIKEISATDLIWEFFEAHPKQ